MAKVKEDLKSQLSKRDKMLKMAAEERKMAEKLGEPITMGNPSDFTDFGRDKYRMTSILGIDLNICGLKDGSINILYGDNSTGKTTNSIGIIEGIQLHNPDAVFAYFDAEQTVDDNFLGRYKHLNQENIFFFRYAMIEKIVDKILELLRGDMVDYIIIDSYDATSSKTTQGKSFENDNQQVMTKAAVLSNAMPEIQELLKKNDATMLILQQIRQQFKQFVAYEGRSGGNTLKFAPSSVLKISNIKDKNEIDENGNPKTRYVKIKNEKSKVSRPYLETFSYINVDPKIPHAILKRKECMDYALLYNIIEASGAWVYMNVVDPETGEIKEEKFNGKAKALKAFDEDLDLYTETKLKVYAAGLPTEVFIVKFDEILTLLEKENENMKISKRIVYTQKGAASKLSEKDKKQFIFDRNLFTPLFVLETTFPEREDESDDYISGKKRYDIASFNLLSIEEQNKIIEEEKAKEEKAKKIADIKLAV